MTWIVGTPTMFGYGLGISDVCVTSDGVEFDCLQKIHPVGHWIAAGFAGSVRIGFAMVEELRQWMYSEDDRIAYEPLSVAEGWPHCARQVFSKFSPEERYDGCHLMLISADPLEHTGNPSWPRSYVHIFKSPDFQAERVSEHTLGSIGCGNEPCREAVEEFSRDYKRRGFFEQGEVGTQGGLATMLGFNLTQLLMRARPGGISSHLHYCWVYRGKIIIETNNFKQKGRWSILKHGSGINRDLDVLDPSASKHRELDGATLFEMPPLAATWEELDQFLKQAGAKAEGCIA